MTTDFNFFITSMPDTRPADHYLGCLDGSVFIDFNDVGQDKICLTRISFDGYGCCDLEDNAIPLTEEDSKIFKDIVKNKIVDQSIIGTIVKKAIALNKTFIWTDALKEYHLI